MRGKDRDAAVVYRVEAFDKNDVIWCYPIEVFPFLIRVKANANVFSFRVWIDQCQCKGIVLGHAPVVAESKRPINRGMRNGSPKVDELPAFFEELRCFVGREMTMDSGDGRLCGLVNVDVRDGLALFGSGIDLSWSAAANRVVKELDSASSRQLFDQLRTFWIIFSFDFFIIDESLVFRGPIGE